MTRKERRQRTSTNNRGPQGSDELAASSNIKLKIVVKETNRKLCTLWLPETATIASVKEQIIKKNENVIVKNLFIKPEQCHCRIIKLFVDGHEQEGDLTTQLKTLSMKNGNNYSITISFLRALAFLS